MITTAAAGILDGLAERRAIESRIMIVVAHPDDETIGMGAQLCRFHDALLVQLTNGAPRDGRDAAAHGYPTIADYASARRLELRAALKTGQAREVRTEIVGVPDQEACFELVPLTERIAARIRTERPQTIFVQPFEGGHPDHDSASFVVQFACRLIEAEGGPTPTIVEMTAYHTDGAGLATGIFLPAPRPVTTLMLDFAERLRKRAMINCFASQSALLAGLSTEVERFREAPNYDFAQPPHAGDLHYEGLDWQIDGLGWRRQAQAARTALGLQTS